jgi:MarR family
MRIMAVNTPTEQGQGINLGREFTTAVVLFQEAVGSALGLSAADRKCLDLLDRLGPVTATTIAQHTGLTTGAITGMIDRLHRTGYVDRTPNPEDRRSVLVTLRPNTPRDAILPAIFGPLAQDMAELSTHFTPEQTRAINQWIAGATDILHRRTIAIKTDAPENLATSASTPTAPKTSA